jgi:hypothetical protein
MDLAVRTTASPAAIWTIVVVAVVCLVFWLAIIWYADAHPYVRQSRLPDMPGPGAAMLDDDVLANLGAAPPQPETRVPGQRTPAGGSAPAETTSHPGAGNQA